LLSKPKLASSVWSFLAAAQQLPKRTSKPNLVTGQCTWRHDGHGVGGWAAPTECHMKIHNGWLFSCQPTYPGYNGQTAVKQVWLLLLSILFYVHSIQCLICQKNSRWSKREAHMAKSGVGFCRTARGSGRALWGPSVGSRVKFRPPRGFWAYYCSGNAYKHMVYYRYITETDQYVQSPVRGCPQPVGVKDPTPGKSNTDSINNIDTNISTSTTGN